MANPVVRHFTKHKLLQGYPEEILFQLRLAREYIFHVGAEPRNGLLLQGSLPTPDMVSSGSGPPHLLPGNVGIDPPQSLGVRMWSSCQRVVDDVYGEPIGGGYEFKSPIVTMGFVEFDEEGGKSIEVGEWGQTWERDARMWIPVLHHLENGFSYPKEGDVVEFWARSWHELGVFYDVAKVATNGRINDTNYFTMWILELRRRDYFLPERRVFSLLSKGVDPVTGDLPPLGDGGVSLPDTSYINEAFRVISPAQLIYPLQHEPLTSLDIDVHWNGINLVPGAGFGTYLPDVRGFVISGSSLVLSDNNALSVDDVIAIGYSYSS